MEIPSVPDLTRFTNFQIVQIDIEDDEPLSNLNERVSDGWRLIATWVSKTPGDEGGYRDILNGLIGRE